MATELMKLSKREVVVLILGLACGLGAGFGFGKFCTQASESTLIADERRLTLVQQYMQNGEYQCAHDALLSAMRVAPGDRRVFEASLEFSRKATKGKAEEATSLGHDIHQRAGALIPFLPLDQMKEAREAYDKLGDELYSPKKEPNQEDPFEEAETLLATCRRSSLP